MKLIKISDIFIPEDRQRKNIAPESVADLETAIAEVGLLNPILLTKNEKTGQITQLVAGETRLKALRNLHFNDIPVLHDGKPVPNGFVPYTELSEQDTLKVYAAELFENTARTKLDWKDQADAVARLHELRTKIASMEGRVHHVADTAKEFHGTANSYTQTKVQQQIIIAKHLDNPLVAKAKSPEEALKILVKQEQAEKLVKQAEIVGKDFNASKHQLRNGDCIEWLQACPTASIDMVLTDPPYGMGAHQFGDAAGKAANFDHQYDDSYESWQTLMQQLCPQLFRVTKANSVAIMFCDFDNFHELKQYMLDAGFRVMRTPLIHHKPNSGKVPLPNLGIRRSHEYMLFAWKGDVNCNRFGDDVISSQADQNTTHGAQKPVALYRELLTRFAAPGQTILDCFAGSGTIFPACHETKTYAIGLEVNPQYYAICLQRLQALDNQAAPVPLDDLLKGM